ncbi:uncharacterized protein [Branchiostoma lanceolatum]|uniref:Hypp9292 protein n=1 Tax=Branchiostoma lanceolatum TaxID=7740 RepID=A0A8J9ZD90_BRALA|nr:Hypp9292 [Branchiostoma lanceolatum]
MNIRQHIGVIFTSVGLLLLMMGTITPAWTSHQIGIWPSCHENTTIESPGTAGLWEECSNMSGIPHWVSVDACTLSEFYFTPNTDCPGGILDRGIIYAGTLEDCAAACCRNPMCQSFQYNCAQVCYLKEKMCTRSQMKGSSCGNMYNRPQAHSTAYHIARFCIMLSTMLLLPGAFLAVSAACKGDLDSAVDGYTIFTTLIIVGGIAGGIGAAFYTIDHELYGMDVPFSVSFYLTWAQTFFSVPGGFLIWHSTKDDDEMEAPITNKEDLESP